jgi:2'-5' RNA ligase
VSYWTCFAFDDIHPDNLHVTHKYLGEQPNASLAIIHVILDRYFRKNGFDGLHPVFSEERMFGPNNDVRVLVPLDRVGDHNYLMDLFVRFDRIHQESFPEYKPHCTTDLKNVTKPLTRYCLMSDHNIIREWKANG